MKYRIRNAIMLSAIYSVLGLLVGGCSQLQSLGQSLSAPPSTQPSAAAIQQASEVSDIYSGLVLLEVAAHKTGVITDAQFVALDPLKQAADAAVATMVADVSAGSSRMQADIAAAQSAIQAYANASKPVLIPPATQ